MAEIAVGAWRRDEEGAFTLEPVHHAELEERSVRGSPYPRGRPRACFCTHGCAVTSLAGFLYVFKLQFSL